MALEVPFASGVTDVSCMREGLKRGHAAYIVFYNTSYTRNIFSIGGADISSICEGLKGDHAVYIDLLIYPTFEVPFVSV